MFKNPSPVDSFNKHEEGVVLEVNSKNNLYKVRTLSGKNLTNVVGSKPNGGSGRSGYRASYSRGDLVVLYYGLGYPIIMFALDKLQVNDEAHPVLIDKNEDAVDPVESSTLTGITVRDKNKPKGVVAGDHILGSEGGGLVASLRSGAVLLKSSRLAQILLSPLGDLVKIVSRNFVHYTDLSSEVIVNLKGRLYRYMGVATTLTKSKTETYNYHEYEGDVALAQAAKSNYLEYSGNPSASTVIRKEQITADNGTEYMYREIHLDGTVDLVVKSGSNFTRIRSTSGTVFITHNDSRTITIDDDEITLTHGGDPIITMKPTYITIAKGATLATLSDAGGAFYNGSNQVVVYPGGVSLTDGAVGMSLASGVATIANGSASAIVTSSNSGLYYGSNYIYVDAGGVHASNPL